MHASTCPVSARDCARLGVEFELGRRRPAAPTDRAEDIHGDLHMHTTATDGKATLEEMVAAAQARGSASTSPLPITRSGSAWPTA